MEDAEDLTLSEAQAVLASGNVVQLLEANATDATSVRLLWEVSVQLAVNLATQLTMTCHFCLCPDYQRAVRRGLLHLFAGDRRQWHVQNADRVARWRRLCVHDDGPGQVPAVRVLHRAILQICRRQTVQLEGGEDP